jgi:hypothetical protein
MGFFFLLVKSCTPNKRAHARQSPTAPNAGMLLLQGRDFAPKMRGFSLKIGPQIAI